MVFENRVLRVIFEPERKDVTFDCRRLLGGELHDLHC
jgi:hypothetical protein